MSLPRDGSSLFVITHTSTLNLSTNQMMSERPDWFLLETAIDGFSTLIDEALDRLMDNPVVVAPPITGTAVNVLLDGDLTDYIECKDSLKRCISRRTAVIHEIRAHPRQLALLSQRQTFGGRLQTLQDLEHTLSYLELEIDALREEAEQYLRSSPHLYEWSMRKFWLEYNLNRLTNIMIPGRDSDLDVVVQNEMFAESVTLYQSIREEFLLIFRRRNTVEDVEESDEDDETDEEDDGVDGDDHGLNDFIG